MILERPITREEVISRDIGRMVLAKTMIVAGFTTRRISDTTGLSLSYIYMLRKLNEQQTNGGRNA